MGDIKLLVLFLHNVSPTKELQYFITVILCWQVTLYTREKKKRSKVFSYNKLHFINVCYPSWFFISFFYIKGSCDLRRVSYTFCIGYLISLLCCFHIWEDCLLKQTFALLVLLRHMTSFVYTHYTMPAVSGWNPASTPSIQTLASNTLYSHVFRISFFLADSHYCMNYFLKSAQTFQPYSNAGTNISYKTSTWFKVQDNWFYIIWLDRQYTCISHFN